MKMRGRPYQGQLSKGDLVEVERSDGAYYTATVLRSPSPVQKTMVFVEYQAVYEDDEGSKPFRGYVDLSHVRPLPPRELNRCFKHGDSVDAYRENGWRKGFVKEILENSKYLVCLNGDGDHGAKEKEECEIEQYNLRLHREWDDGSWVPPLAEPAKPYTKTDDKSRKVKVKIVFGKGPAANATFQKGDEVEVTSEVEGFRGSWFSAVVVEYKGNGNYVVEYLTLRTEQGMPLREEAEERHIRPRPPELLSTANFDLHEAVDAYYNDGWWVGKISRVLSGSKYTVYFSQSNEELEFDHSNLRIHQDWMNGKWTIASENASNLSYDMQEKSQPVVPKSKKLPQMMDVKGKRPLGNFPIGMQVEVKSDEQGYEGSWFSAVIVESLGSDKYLVEYQTLKTEDEDAFLREEAYASYIRPCPPLFQHTQPYKLLESVDAWYNDGWWAGRIVRIFTGLRYAVYFWTSCEQLEFDHADLRPHLEWINGKWVASPGSS